MSISLESVIELLDSMESYYVSISKFGPEVLPHLETVIRTENPLRAAKAAYVVGLIESPKSVKVLSIAASSKFADVRAAAAAGCRYLSEEPVRDLLELLKNDKDESVRKRALKSLELKGA